MAKGEQLMAAIQGLSQREAGEPQDMRKTRSTMAHEFMEPIQFLKHQVSEACLLWPSVTLQPAGNGNKTEGKKWSEEGSHVLNDTILMREISAFHPLEPWRLLCSIHQQAWGEKLNRFSIWVFWAPPMGRSLGQSGHRLQSSDTRASSDPAPWNT